MLVNDVQTIFPIPHFEIGNMAEVVLNQETLICANFI